MRIAYLIVAVLASGAWSSGTLAQDAREGRPPAQPACPPDVQGDAPTIGRADRSQSPSDKLSESKGIVCPPAGVDPGIQVHPPPGGDIRIIPPPGSPGGNPDVQPK